MKVGFQDPITGKPVMAEPADWERREAMLIIVVEVLREVGVEVNQSTPGRFALGFRVGAHLAQAARLVGESAKRHFRHAAQAWGNGDCSCGASAYLPRRGSRMVGEPVA